MPGSAIFRLSILTSIAATALALGSPVFAQNEQPTTLVEALGLKSPGLRGAELEAAVVKARAYPLGSQQNPVRTVGLGGQRSYLARLRCSNGKAPKVLNRGIGMPSPFGGITDIYSVHCSKGAPEHASVAMDMYHEQVETQAVPGFTIVDR